MKLLKVKKVQAAYQLETAINDVLSDLAKQNIQAKSVQFVDECVAFVVYEINIAPDVKINDYGIEVSS